ncbi:unnamed protein product, partial [Amoebophrya sp. A25]
KAWLNTNVVVDGSPAGDVAGATLNAMPKIYTERLANGFNLAFLGVCTADSPSLTLQDPT